MPLRSMPLHSMPHIAACSIGSDIHVNEHSNGDGRERQCETPRTRLPIADMYMNPPITTGKKIRETGMATPTKVCSNDGNIVALLGKEKAVVAALALARQSKIKPTDAEPAKTWMQDLSGGGSANKNMCSWGQDTQRRGQGWFRMEDNAISRFGPFTNMI